jgi:hypothetical protein
MQASGIDLLEMVKALGSLTTPIVVAAVAYLFQRRQKRFEATISEKARYYAAISPLLNRIYSYRKLVNDYLDRSPEEILQAKREADRVFWTHIYIWSPEFRRAYQAFMGDAFAMWQKGGRAVLRVDGRNYAIGPSTPGWQGFSGEPTDDVVWDAIYRRLQWAIAHDLGVARRHEVAMPAELRSSPAGPNVISNNQDRSSGVRRPGPVWVVALPDRLVSGPLRPCPPEAVAEHVSGHRLHHCG